MSEPLYAFQKQQQQQQLQHQQPHNNSKLKSYQSQMNSTGNNSGTKPSKSQEQLSRAINSPICHPTQSGSISSSSHQPANYQQAASPDLSLPQPTQPGRVLNEYETNNNNIGIL